MSKGPNNSGSIYSRIRSATVTIGITIVGTVIANLVTEAITNHYLPSAIYILL